MILNNTPVKTSINYGINYFEIPSSALKTSIKNYNGFTIENADNYEIFDNSNSKLKNSMCKELENLNKNFSKKIVISKSLLKPLVLNFNLNKNEALIEDLSLEINKGVRANVVIKLNSSFKAYHIGLLNLKLNQNSCLNLVVINNLSENSTNIFSQQSEILQKANLNFFNIDFGCEYSVFYNNAILQENDAKSSLQNIYLGKNTNKLDYNFVQNVEGENCKSYINSLGALLNKSTKNFKGTIVFNKGCKKSLGDENEFCLLLSKHAKSKALPVLLCSEEDVSGNHSTAVGKINPKELFYVMSRGLTKLEAVKLLVKAKFARVLSEIFNEDLKQEILNKIDEKIEYEE